MSATYPGTSILIYCIAGVAFIVGLVLLLFAWRGKRVDDHPWCRKCRFDLFGRDDRQDANCPECGGDLTRPKAVRVGQRRKRRGGLILATVLLLLGFAGLGGMGYVDAAAIDWQAYKPTWWLIREANQPPGTDSDAALVELVRRMDAGDLDAKSHKQLAVDALLHHGDQSRTWQTQWSELFEQARLDGLVTDTQWQQYAKQIIVDPLEIKLRSQIRHGQPRLLFADWGSTPFRVNDGDLFRYVHSGIRSFELYRVDDPGFEPIELDVSFGPRDMIDFPTDVWNRVPPGQYTLRTTVVYSIYDADHPIDLHSIEWAGSSLFGDDEEDEEEEKPLAEKTLVFEQPIECVPADQPTIKINRDPGLKQAVENSVHFADFRYESWGGYNIDFVSTTSCPIDLAFDVIVRHQGNEYKAASVLDSPTTGIRFAQWREKNTSYIGERVDVILRPSIEYAQASRDCYEIWGEEIIFKDVLIEDGTSW